MSAAQKGPSPGAQRDPSPGARGHHRLYFPSAAGGAAKASVPACQVRYGVPA